MSFCAVYQSTAVTKKSDFFLCRSQNNVFTVSSLLKKRLLYYLEDKQAWIFHFLLGETIWVFTIKATFWLASTVVFWPTIWQWWLPGITQWLNSTRKMLRKKSVDSDCISVNYLAVVSAVKGQHRNISICLMNSSWGLDEQDFSV